MERSAKSRQTVMITQNLNADPMWTQNLPLSFVPDEVIVRSVRYLADPADPSTMAFVTADFIQNSNRQLLCEFSPDWIVSQNTTFTNAGAIILPSVFIPICQVSHPNSHFTFNKASSNSTATFTAVRFNGTNLVLATLAGNLSIHLEFVQWDTK